MICFGFIKDEFLRNIGQLLLVVFDLNVYFFQAITLIGKEDGIKGYWKRNLPQVPCFATRSKVYPYSSLDSK